MTASIVATPTFVPVGAPTRVRVLVGEDDDAARRNGKQAIAWSACTYYGPDLATVTKIVDALRDSDERLRSRPEQQMLWDWKSTWFEADALADNPNGGGTIHLGVAWYDEAFFKDRSGAWFGAMHQRIYQDLGVPLEDITVTHWVTAPAS